LEPTSLDVSSVTDHYPLHVLYFGRTLDAKRVKVKSLLTTRWVSFANNEGIYTKNMVYNEVLC